MPRIYIKFSDMPTIGFAHHFNMDNYSEKYTGDENSFEIVYVKSGSLAMEIFGKTYDIPPMSVFLLCRNLPIRLTSVGGEFQSHCTVQIKTNGHIEFFEDDSDSPLHRDGGICLPMILSPCEACEVIKKDLYSIISTISSFGEDGNFSASICALGILSKLDNIYMQKLHTKKSNSSIIEYKIKRYVADNISKPISLSTVSEAIGKSSNYLNGIFKKNTGISIHQYITKEKVRIIGECIKLRNLTFRDACESVSVFDVSYGYRLFKKHNGITPNEFISSTRIIK